MPTPNYKESQVAGTQWQRAVRVVVENPLNGTPSLMFVEEQATQLGDRIITEPCANLGVSFDPNSQLHADIYTKLNELYTLLREARDAAQAVTPTI